MMKKHFIQAIFRWARSRRHAGSAKSSRLSAGHTPLPYRLSGGTERMGELGLLDEDPHPVDTTHEAEIPQGFRR